MPLSGSIEGQLGHVSLITFTGEASGNALVQFSITIGRHIYCEILFSHTI